VSCLSLLDYSTKFEHNHPPTADSKRQRTDCHHAINLNNRKFGITKHRNNNGADTTSTSESEIVPTQALHLEDAIFLNDTFVFTDAKSKRAFSVTAAEPELALSGRRQCIWAGELGVRLTVTDKQTGQTQDVGLGMIRAKTARALGSLYAQRH
jgi:hypothetical protein